MGTIMTRKCIQKNLVHSSPWFRKWVFGLTFGGMVSNCTGIVDDIFIEQFVASRRATMWKSNLFCWVELLFGECDDCIWSCHIPYVLGKLTRGIANFFYVHHQNIDIVWKGSRLMDYRGSLRAPNGNHFCQRNILELCRMRREIILRQIYLGVLWFAMIMWVSTASVIWSKTTDQSDIL